MGLLQPQQSQLGDIFARVADRASVYEVSPRDGLQNEAAPIPIDGKRKLIDALIVEHGALEGARVWNLPRQRDEVEVVVLSPVLPGFCPS